MKKIYTAVLSGLAFMTMALSPGCKHYSENTSTAPVMDTRTAFIDSLDSALADTKVFVCKSTAAKKYHFNENCTGLRRCTHEIVTMTVKEAEGMGLGLCGYED